MIVKRVRFGLTFLLLGAAAIPLAWADGARHRGHYHGGFGVYLGAPWPGGYYGYPPYFYPPIVALPSAPPVYIEREPLAAPQAPGYWYFCSNPEGYYPYIQECAAGWQRVAPRPQASPQ